MNRTINFCFKAIFLSTAFVLTICPDLFARAGGGGGGGRGGIAAIILYPFLVIYSAIITHVAWKKNRECVDFAEKLDRQDPLWSPHRIRGRIEVIFYKVQEAWMERDQTIAQSFMSKKLFERHKAQTDSMIRKKEKNILENMTLHECQIIQIVDYKDDSRDRVSVLLKASMVDYTINEETGKIVSGDKGKKSFKEIWKFAREGNDWVLDEIDSDVHLDDLFGTTAFTENN